MFKSRRDLLKHSIHDCLLFELFNSHTLADFILSESSSLLIRAHLSHSGFMSVDTPGDSSI